MKLKLAAAIVLILLAGDTPSAADELGDCNQTRVPILRLRACSQIISGPAFTPQQKAVAYRNRAGARADAGAVDQAIADFDAAVRLNPSDAASHGGRGRVRLSRGDIDGAIVDFTSALRILPAASTYLIDRGHAYLVKDLSDFAVADFTEAIRISPKSASAFNNRGLACRKQNDLQRAVDDYSRAIEINPLYGLAYSNRGNAFEALGRKAEAINDFQYALLIDRSLTGAAAGLKRLRATGPLAKESETLVTAGRALVEANCSQCHAVGTAGDSPNAKAPAFRLLQRRHPVLALREPLSRAIAAPHDEMPKFTLADADIDKIVAYINSLLPQKPR